MNDWIWMPHPGHFICSRDCRFHLNTKAGHFIVSTVGEYLPDAPIREILASTRGITLGGIGDARLRSYMEKIGYEDLGFERKYETMVFPALKSDTECCPFTADYGSGELEMQGYNDAGSAYAGHMDLCRKWAKKPIEAVEGVSDADEINLGLS